MKSSNILFNLKLGSNVFVFATMDCHVRRCKISIFVFRFVHIQPEIQKQTLSPGNSSTLTESFSPSLSFLLSISVFLSFYPLLFSSLSPPYLLLFYCVCVYMFCACSGMFDFFRVITLFLTLALALLTVCLNSFSSRPLAPWLSISLSRYLPSTPRTKVCGSQQTARHVSSEVQSSPIYPAAQWASTGARQLEGGSRRRRTLLCRLCCHSRFIDWCVFISLNQLITFAYTN